MQRSLVLSWLCAFCVITALSCVPLAFSEHAGWQDHYTDAIGVPCCGTRDCRRTVGRLLDRDGDQVQAEVQGVPLWISSYSVHPSKDGAFWVCVKGSLDGKHPLASEQIRCVFLATGG